MCNNHDVKFLGPIWESEGHCSLLGRQLCCSLAASQHSTIIKLCFSGELHAALALLSEGWKSGLFGFWFCSWFFCLFFSSLEADLKRYIDKEMQISYGQAYCSCHSYAFESGHQSNQLFKGVFLNVVSSRFYVNVYWFIKVRSWDPSKSPPVFMSDLHCFLLWLLWSSTN